MYYVHDCDMIQAVSRECIYITLIGKNKKCLLGVMTAQLCFNRACWLHNKIYVRDKWEWKLGKQRSGWSPDPQDGLQKMMSVILWVTKRPLLHLGCGMTHAHFRKFTLEDSERAWRYTRVIDESYIVRDWKWDFQF